MVAGPVPFRGSALIRPKSSTLTICFLQCGLGVLPLAVDQDGAAQGRSWRMQVPPSLRSDAENCKRVRGADRGLWPLLCSLPSFFSSCTCSSANCPSLFLTIFCFEAMRESYFWLDSYMLRRSACGNISPLTTRRCAGWSRCRMHATRAVHHLPYWHSSAEDHQRLARRQKPRRDLALGAGVSIHRFAVLRRGLVPWYQCPCGLAVRLLSSLEDVVLGVLSDCLAPQQESILVMVGLTALLLHTSLQSSC